MSQRSLSGARQNFLNGVASFGDRAGLRAASAAELIPEASPSFGEPTSGVPTEPVLSRPATITRQLSWHFASAIQTDIGNDQLFLATQLGFDAAVGIGNRGEPQKVRRQLRRETAEPGTTLVGHDGGNPQHPGIMDRDFLQFLLENR